MASRFLVARNPDPDSQLPYLLFVPVGRGLVLKARDTWPHTSQVYCHRVEEWPADAEIVEDVTVLECRRREVAVDLVLDRKREARSQFVFTKLPTGREGIFWETRKVVGTVRPASLLKVSHAPSGFLPDLLARVQVRYPEVPIVFLETRPLTEEWTYRWLGAALAEAQAEGDAWGPGTDDG